MNINRKILVVSTVVVALAAGGIGIAYAVGGDSEEQATGPGADRAKAAAVKAVGGGSVIAVERDDSGSAYEVEVKRGDGSVIEVQVTDGKAGATGSDDDTGGEPEGSDSGENDD